MSYRHVYVAQIALGSKSNASYPALNEAESYDGPAIVIAYAQCIAHGIDMTHGAEQQRRAVQSGYWLLYRFNPLLISQNKQPLQLDSKAPMLPLVNILILKTAFVV